MKAMTPEFRMSYPKLFKAEKNELNGKMEYSVVAIFPKGADLSKLKKAAADACVKKWGADKSKWPQPNPATGQGGVRSPFRDQAERGKKDDATGKITLPPGFEAGAIFINLKSEQAPQIVDEQVQPVIDTAKIYAGCWAIASVNAYAYSFKGNSGVAFGLGNVQRVRDGDHLGGGRTRAVDDFAPIAGAQDAVATDATDLFN